MREIKFRGWYVTQKKMYDCEEMTRDQLTLLPDGHFINVNSFSEKLSTIFPTDKFIPLQYTGLKDKNGKEIYEGDIVKNPYAVEPEDLGWEVCWQEIFSAFEFIRIRKNIDGSTESWMPNIDSVSNEFEVIGNIYENPEIIK